MLDRSLKKSYGQIFTPRNIVEFMINMASIDDTSSILEPSSGNGIFLSELTARSFLNIDAYEIDKSIIKHSFVKNESFVSANINKKYDLVIGNPPYVRWKNLLNIQKNELKESVLWSKYCNSLCDYFYFFILKSIYLLRENGSLIFICPDYWLSTKNASKLRKYMMKNGFFKQLILFKENKVFNGVSSSIMIFHYIKSSQRDDTIKINLFSEKVNIYSLDLFNLDKYSNVFNIEQFSGDNWIVATKKEKNNFSMLEDVCNGYRVEDICDIGNGMVSGLDKAFRMSDDICYSVDEIDNSIKVYKAKNLDRFVTHGVSRYIFLSNIEHINIEKIKKKFPNFYNQLVSFKEKLECRYSYNKFIPYWHWSFLRNYTLFSRNEKRIFVPSKERISSRKFFRFALIDADIYPTQDVTALFKKKNIKESIEYIVSYLNLPVIFNWIKYNGVIKGDVVEFSKRPLANIPFRKIDWNDENEVIIHNEITELTNLYISNLDNVFLDKIYSLFKRLGVLV